MTIKVRGQLSSFGLSGKLAIQKMSTLSGGQKSRVIFATITWKKPQVLLLDEPTNHLDLDMRNALSLALQDYEGAVVLVSHDRFLVRSTVDQLMLVAEGKLQPFDGDLVDYEKWLLKFRKLKPGVIVK